MPGVLARVDQVLAEHDVNIGGQVLATRGDLRLRGHRHRRGCSTDVLAELRAVPETIRLRIID